MSSLDRFLFPFEKVPKGSRIIIYGAGKKGQTYLRQMLLTGYCEVVAMADKGYASYGQMVVPVCAPQDIHTYVFDYVVIALSTVSYQNEFFSVLENQGISENRIIYQKNREDVLLFQKKKASSGAGHLLAWQKSKKNMIFYIIGGYGDTIVQKRIVDTFVAIEPDLCIDVYCKEGLEFLRFLYEDTPQIQWIDRNLGVRYEEEREGYAAAIEFDGGYALHVDALQEPSPFSKSLSGILRTLKERTEKERSEGTSAFTMFSRCIYRKENGYAKLSYGGAIPYRFPHVHIPNDPAGAQQFQQMGRGNYVTVNFGNGSVSNSTLVAKSWPKINFEKVIAGIHAMNPDITVVQLGAKGAECLAGADRFVFGKSFSLVSQVLKHSCLHIDIEGGLVHLASNLGTKCIVLFGPTAVEYFGYPENINLRAGNCHNCYSLYDDCNRCARDLAEPECMYSITPEMVMEYVKAYLEEGKG